MSHSEEESPGPIVGGPGDVNGAMKREHPGGGDGDGVVAVSDSKERAVSSVHHVDTRRRCDNDLQLSDSLPTTAIPGDAVDTSDNKIAVKVASSNHNIKPVAESRDEKMLVGSERNMSKKKGKSNKRVKEQVRLIVRSIIFPPFTELALIFSLLIINVTSTL